MVTRFLFALMMVALVIWSTAPAKADVAFIAILDVPAGNQEAFDALAKKMVAASKEDEGLLIYEFARVGDKVYGYERYTNDDAHERHQALIEPFIPELLKLAKFDSIVTLSPISDRIKPGMEQIGATFGEPISGVAQGKLGR